MTVTPAPSAPAECPPLGLTGVRPEWSRLVEATDHTGTLRTWHILDNHVTEARLTVLCVHGNPSWSYLWRKVVAQAPPDVRVIAVDQLDMGFSERTGIMRRLADRIEDLSGLTEELDLDGPVVTLAHDWGGPISLGWAQRNLGQVVGTILCNTAAHQPAGSPAPAVIRATRTPSMLRNITVNTTAFLRGAIEMSRPRLPTDVARAFLAPYRSADRRHAIADFVEDIPLDPSHPSATALDAIAADLEHLADTPALLLWGPKDPVFSDLYLHDLEQRLPNADVHRFVSASHFVPEDADVAGAVFTWLKTLEPSVVPEPTAPRRRPRLWSELTHRQANDDTAVIDQSGRRARSISWRELHRRVMHLAAGLPSVGVHPGDRVALLIPPGIELNVALYACWRLGAVIVLVDSGLGPRNMSRAIASAHPDHVVGIPKATAAARTLRWPGARISTSDFDRIEQSGASLPVPATPGADVDAAVVFTSGSTGPSKGVVYKHHQLQAQRDALAELYTIDRDDRLVAAFAPFALYGPALGITSVVPDMNVAKPGSLTATAFAAAAVAVDATMAFASPAALANVVATRSSLTAQQTKALGGLRLVLSAGAPVSQHLLEDAALLAPLAAIHTPYGMTEALPVADISLTELRRCSGNGVCVGKPRVVTQISPINGAGAPAGDFVSTVGVTGEVVVAAPHGKDRYDRLWYTDALATPSVGWHRTGDLGHLDSDGNLWIEGRVEHAITAPAGVITPVGIEHAVAELRGVSRAAAVGIGPTGTQVVAVIVELDDHRPTRFANPRADLALTDLVRSAAAPIDVAAVLIARSLPVDQRHNSKVDRRRVATWAETVLAGERIGAL